MPSRDRTRVTFSILHRHSPRTDSWATPWLPAGPGAADPNLETVPQLVLNPLSQSVFHQLIHEDGLGDRGKNPATVEVNNIHCSALLHQARHDSGKGWWVGEGWLIINHCWLPVLRNLPHHHDHSTITEQWPLATLHTVLGAFLFWIY